MTDIRSTLDCVGKKYECPNSAFHVTRLKTLEEFMALENDIKHAEKLNLLLSKYIFIDTEIGCGN